MPSLTFKQRMQEEGLDPTFQGVAWRITQDIWSLCYPTICMASDIDETFPEYRQTNIRLSKEQNTMFHTFRRTFRELINVSRPHIIQRKKVVNVSGKINEIFVLMNKRYGTFDIRALTKLAYEYQDMLVDSEILGTPGRYEENAYNQLRKL